MSGLDLYWLPLGAGGTCVRTNGRIYERAAVAAQHRTPRDLYHAALAADLPEGRVTVEMAPAWSRPQGVPERGVVRTGPVGLRPLGRWPWFRYEVRCWAEGVIPDLAYAVGGPRRLTDDETVVRRVLTAVPLVPSLTWGRDELGVGEMWNSNSVVAWALVRGGVDASAVPLPDGGRAPGFTAGIRAAGPPNGGPVADSQDR